MIRDFKEYSDWADTKNLKYTEIICQEIETDMYLNRYNTFLQSSDKICKQFADKYADWDTAKEIENYVDDAVFGAVYTEDKRIKNIIRDAFYRYFKAIAKTNMSVILTNLAIINYDLSIEKVEEILLYSTIDENSSKNHLLKYFNDKLKVNIVDKNKPNNIYLYTFSSDDYNKEFLANFDLNKDNPEIAKIELIEAIDKAFSNHYEQYGESEEIKNIHRNFIKVIKNQVYKKYIINESVNLVDYELILKNEQ